MGKGLRVLTIPKKNRDAVEKNMKEDIKKLKASQENKPGLQQLSDSMCEIERGLTRSKALSTDMQEKACAAAKPACPERHLTRGAKRSLV